MDASGKVDGEDTHKRVQKKTHIDLFPKMWSPLCTGCATMCWALYLRTAYSILFILVTFPRMCWVQSFSPFYSLSLLKYACAFQQPSHNAWNRMPTSHTFLIRFPVESWSFISDANWNCCHNHTGIVLSSGLIHYHCLNVLIGNFRELFFSFLCTLPLGRRLGWRALGEVYWYEEQEDYIL